MEKCESCGATLHKNNPGQHLRFCDKRCRLFRNAKNRTAAVVNWVFRKNKI